MERQSSGSHQGVPHSHMQRVALLAYGSSPEFLGLVHTPNRSDQFPRYTIGTIFDRSGPILPESDGSKPSAGFRKPAATAAVSPRTAEAADAAAADTTAADTAAADAAITITAFIVGYTTRRSAAPQFKRYPPDRRTAPQGGPTLNDLEGPQDVTNAVTTETKGMGLRGAVAGKAVEAALAPPLDRVRGRQWRISGRRYRVLRHAANPTVCLAMVASRHHNNLSWP